MSLSKSDSEFVKRIGEWRALDSALASKQRRINELEEAIKLYQVNPTTNNKYDLFELLKTK